MDQFSRQHRGAATRWRGPRILRWTWLLAGLLFAAVGPGLATPAGAATTAVFYPQSGLLSVYGDSLDNTITIGRTAAGGILINGGTVAPAGGTPTVATTARIEVFGVAGNDVLTLDQINGALPAAYLYGGSGDDTLAGGAGADQLFGEVGNDTLSGKGGIDFLFGGKGDDTLTGGDGDDQAFGQEDSDRFSWIPGDDSDLNEGGDGEDTVEVSGGGGTEHFVATANGTRVYFERLDPAPFELNIGTVEDLVLNAKAGDDTFSGIGNLAALIELTVDGGAGNDTLLGGNGVDTLLGGDGADVVDGQFGDDVALLGAGDDAFLWDPGDGSDTVEGQAGADTLVFNGSSTNEVVELAANGTWLRLTRDVAGVALDLAGIERADVVARGGADTILVGDLAGTGVATVAIDLALASGDAQPDTVVVHGTGGIDTIAVGGSSSGVGVSELAAAVTISGAKATGDQLVIGALTGADTVDASGLPAGLIRLTIDGGEGDDTLVGSAGDDTFVWEPGDGSDRVEGQAGADTLRFHGSGENEAIVLAADGGRLRLARDVAAVAMDLAGVERVDLTALGSGDTITVGDLAGTGVTAVTLSLAVAPASPLALSVVGAGTVTATPASPTGTRGALISLVATPEPGAVFAGWTVDGVAQGRAATLLVTMSSGHSVVANFVPVP